MNRKTLRVLLPLIFAGIAGAGWLYMGRSHRDIGAEQARFKMVPSELRLAMATDSSAPLYLNEVVELFGVIVQDDGTRAILEGGVVATWDTLRSHRPLQEGELLRLKGRVTGYDDLFEEVRMDGLVTVEETDD